MAKKSDKKSITNLLFGGSSKSDAKSSSKKSSGAKGEKRVKSKEEQRKDIARFGAKVAVGGAAAAKAAKRKGKKGLVGLIVVLCLVIFGAGVMYYFDVAPLDFVIDAVEFKYYTYEVSGFESNALTPVAATGELRIHFIDVGQGDSIFIQFPDGKTMLIDGGEKRTAVAEGIPAYLLALYPDQDKVTIDYCMLTHCDSDHSGSLDDVVAHDKIDVLNVYQPRVYSSFASDPLKTLVGEGKADAAWDNIPTITTGVYQSFVEAVYNEREALGDAFGDIYYNMEGMYITSELDAVNPDYWSIHMYNPSEELYKEKLSTAYDKNNISPIMVLQYAGQDILLTGDADEAAEVNFAEKRTDATLFDDGFTWDGDCEVLKVAHHGGADSTLQPFLDVVKPEHAVISVGANNKHKHPRQVTLDRLTSCGSAIYMTMEKGSIVLTVSSNGLEWEFSAQQTTSAAIFGLGNLTISQIMGSGGLRYPQDFLS